MKRHPKCFIAAIAASIVMLLNIFTVIPLFTNTSFSDVPIQAQSFESDSPQTPFGTVSDPNPDDPETLAHRPYSRLLSIPLAGPFDDQQLGYYASREWMPHRIVAQSTLSPDLLESIRLDLASNLPLRFDHVYTWVNGSDPRLLPMRKYYQEQSPVYKSFIARTQRGRVMGSKAINTGGRSADRLVNRFRDLDELRYSIRSVAMHGMSFLRRIHLFTSNIAQGTEEDGNQSCSTKTNCKQVEASITMSLSEGQIPQWLGLDALTKRHDFRISHHAHVFDRNEYLPTFNSLAIESQLYRLPDLSDVFVYMNDDTFFNRPLSPASIWTPLYGFVFHFESSLLVTPEKPYIDYSVASNTDDWLTQVDGEWNSLHYTNFLLSKQFGARPRAYVAHIPHVLSRSILYEMAAVWPGEVLATSSHRFRGEGQGQDIHTTFMFAHYVAERLRETQLRSFWTHVLDANHDRHLSWDERRWLVDRVREWNAYQLVMQQRQNDALSRAEYWTSIRQNHTRPSFLEGAESTLARTGLAWYGYPTVYTASGMDGYPYMHQPSNTSFDSDSPGKDDHHLTYSTESPSSRTCTFDLDFCLGTAFSDSRIDVIDAFKSEALFDRLAFRHYRCGDCLLLLLLQHPDLGLTRGILPRNKTTSAYASVVRDLARYNYVVGSSSYEFVMLKQSSKLNQEALNRLAASGDRHAFFCVNDNMPDTAEVDSITRPLFRQFLEDRFPVTSPWESRPVSNISTST
ncbi:Xanthine phosphoribosyltransferase 1 [Actinomortierella wolfii]|nr:Xanthine phosphoribosyltransferase 1 [Actinomortierella wolfii]